MSLKWKLSIFVAGLLALAVALFAGFLLWSEGRALRKDAERARSEAGRGLSEVCRGALLGGEDLLLNSYLHKLKESPEVREAACADGAGFILGHTDVARLHTRLPSSEAGHTDGPGTEEVRLSINVGDRLLGVARILFDRSVIRGRLNESLREARRRILAVSLLVLMIGFAGSFVAVRFALRPVDALVAGARAIGDGRLDHVVAGDRSDELGLLAREFNRMGGKLRELDVMKQDFVNGITHDLKSPLAAVSSAADLVRREAEKSPNPSGMLQNLLLVRQNADRLMNLVTSILDVAHIESALELHKAPVLLEEIAMRASQPLRSMAGAKGLSLEVSVLGNLAPIPLDAGKMERALANLIGNAVKFTERGSITVEVDRASGGQVLRVVDTGPGIPPEFLGRLFTKFSRASRPGGPKVEGSGLGLAIAKEIVEGHGGRIEVRSEEGKGSTFSVFLPEGAP
jgi:signal transduction histidine kinase